MNDIDQWLNKIRKNKSQYAVALKNIDNHQVLKLRREAAEAGFEMTPSEVYSYLNILRDIVLDK
jgi:hypothetical protein